MGLLIAPYLVGAIVVSIISIIKVIVLVMDKQVSSTQFELGLLASVILLALIALGYIIEKKVYALSPMFRLPMYMVILPFMIAIDLQKTYPNYSTILLISASISAIAIIALNNFVFKILRYLPVTIYY